MSTAITKLAPFEFSLASDSQIKPVTALHKGSSARIVSINEFTEFGQNSTRVAQRIKELGFLPGALIKVIGFGFLKNSPVALEINGTKFALRPAEASKILVKPV